MSEVRPMREEEWKSSVEEEAVEVGGVEAAQLDSDEEMVSQQNEVQVEEAASDEDSPWGKSEKQEDEQPEVESPNGFGFQEEEDEEEVNGELEDNKSLEKMEIDEEV